MDTHSVDLKMQQSARQMAISELSSRSGMPVSTIKYYIREGILPKPFKTGETRGYYTIKHLDRLKLIEKIQKESQLPIQKIREITTIIDSGEERQKREEQGNALDQEDVILQAATALFREKGYEATTIADIVNAAGIGRSTFYRNFENKKVLFIASIRRITLKEGVPEGLDEISKEDGFVLFDRSADAYFRQGDLWWDMIRRLRAAAINDADEFGEILEEAMQLKINQFRKRIRESVRQGFMREVNPTLLAVMILGVQEACSEYVAKGLFRESPKTIFEQVKDILLQGIRKKEPEHESEILS